MAKRVSEKLLTLEQYEDLESLDGYRDELVRGWLVREPGPGPRHGEIALTIGALLKAHVKANKLGKVFSETGYVLAEQPPTVRGPDVSFVSGSRAGPEAPVRYYRFAPDLAVEVLSPANRATEVNDKIKQYLASGTRAVWVLDARNRMVLVYQPDGSAAVLNEHDDLDGGDVVPGFRVRVADLFDG